MKFSTSSVLLATALGVSAHPHGAAHIHARHDANLEVREKFVMNVKPVTVTQTATTTVAAVQIQAAAATTTSVSSAAAVSSSTSSAAAAASSASSGSSGTIGSSGSYTGTFCTGTSKRATAADIAYTGNIGSPTYGCNMKLVESSDAKNYQYIVALENGSSQKQVCACFMKTGPDGFSTNGFWKGNQVIDLTLAVGESKYLAVQAQTIGGCACGPNSLPTTSIGQISGEWLEFEFGNKNKGFTGADASSLVAAAAGQTLQGLTITKENPEYVNGSEKKSVIYATGDGCNAFPAGTKDQDGHGFNIANTLEGADAVRLHAKWGTGGTIADCPVADWRQIAQ